MAPVNLPDSSMHTIYIVEPREMFIRYSAALDPTARLREGAQVGFLVVAAPLRPRVRRRRGLLRNPLPVCSDRHCARVRAAATPVRHPRRGVGGRCPAQLARDDHSLGNRLPEFGGGLLHRRSSCLPRDSLPGSLAPGMSRVFGRVSHLGDLVPRDGDGAGCQPGRDIRGRTARERPQRPFPRRRSSGGGGRLGHARPNGRLGSDVRAVRLHRADLFGRVLPEPAGSDTALSLCELALGPLCGVPAGSSCSHRHVRSHLRTQTP